MTDDSRRRELAAVVEHIQEHADQLHGLARFADALARMSTVRADGMLTLNIDGLADAEVDEMLTPNC